MRSSSSFAVLGLLAFAAACSRDRPAPDQRLDLVLGDQARPAPVASALELAGEARTPSVSRSQSGLVAHLHATHRAHTRKVAARPQPAPAAPPAPVETRVAEPAVAVSAPAPAPAPAAEPEPAPPLNPAEPEAPEPRARGGWGGWSAPTDGGGMPGIPGTGGGVIIIRGGHSGMDPCDEHDRRHGMGGGIFPRLPSAIGRGFPGGGIRFLRSR